MKSLPILLALALSGMLFSCKSSNSTGTLPADAGLLVPLRVGNTWVFHKTDFASVGSIKKEWTDSVKILNFTKINTADGTTWYDYTGTDFRMNVYNLSAPKIPGFYIIGDNLIYEQLWFKYPANVGDIFRWGPIYQTVATPTAQKPDSIVNLSGVFTVAAKNVSVIGDDGVNYTCYKYESDFSDAHGVTYLQTFEYYAPNIGEILREDYARDASGTLKLIHREKLTSKTVLQ